MKLFGTLRELVAAVFRKDGKDVTLGVGTQGGTATTREFNLPAVTSNTNFTHELIAKDLAQITNDDINAGANIADTKLATISTAGKVSGGAITSGTIGGSTSVNTSGTITASSFSGPLTGNVTGNVSGSAATFTGSLSGEVTGTQSATVVADDVIDNANIKSTAGIEGSKLQAASASNAGAVTTGAQTFAGVKTFNSNPNLAGLTDSQAVVTDASKNLASLAYTTAATGSTLMSRDVAGSTSVNTLNAGNIDVTGLATMDKAYIDGASGGGFIEFEGQTVADVPAPTVGEARLFAGTDGKIYVRKAGSSQAEELGAGGSGEINLVDNSSDAGNWGVVNATATTNTTAANNPLSGTIDTSIAIASSTLNGYVRYRFSMPAALKQRKLKLEWYQIASSLTSGAYKVEVWTNSDVTGNYNVANYTELSLSTDSAGTSSIPNLNGKYSTTFDTNGSDYYEIRIVRTAASAATLYIANVVCGPGIQPQGAVVSAPIAYTPSTDGFGTVAGVTAFYTRRGNYIKIQGRFTTGTVNANTAFVSLPAGLNIDTSAVTSNLIVGKWTRNQANANLRKTGPLATDFTVNANILRFNNDDYTTAAAPSVPQTGSAIAANSEVIWFDAELPIAEWAGSGTVQLAQNDVEYVAYDGAAAVYGPAGTLVPNIAGTTGVTTYTFAAQTPAQRSGALVVELIDPNGAIRANVGNFIAGTSNFFFGVQVYTTSDGSITTNFGNGGVVTSGGLNAAAAISDQWSSLRTAGWKWRVRKSSAGSAVGFGIHQPGVSAGLVSASGLVGNTTGNAIASGYVGEKLAANGAGGAVAASTAFANIASVTLTPGLWAVTANAGVTISTIAGWTYFQTNISTSNSNFDANTSGGIFSFVPGSSTSTTGSPAIASLGTRYFNVTVNTPVYLIGRIDYSSQTSCTWNVNSRIEAIRIA